jgi:hypothetical protein
MKTASHNLIAGRLDGRAPGGLLHAIHLVRPVPHAVVEADPQTHPHAKRQAFGKVLFTLARLAPAMLWLGNYGWNR